MPGELSREIQKLEIRLNTLMGKEEAFAEGLRNCLDKLMELNMGLEGLKGEAGPKRVGELMSLRLEAIKALSGALRRSGEAELEKIHLLESYGALILALEAGFKDLLSHP